MEWYIDPVFVKLGPIEIRYYGVFFAIGLLLAANAVPRYFAQRGLPRKHGDALCLWMALFMIVGAHLVHLIFYEPEAFWYNPRRIIEIGSGLASHGGGLGAVLAVLIFARRNRADPWAYFDASMAGACFVIPFVRLGNFFNSEIVGRASDVPWAVKFPWHDCIRYARPPPHECAELVARHPSQLYEATIGFTLIAIAVWLQARYRNRLRKGATFALLLLIYFASRIGVEYFKEYQVLSTSFPFTMGQLLSMPIVLFCLWVLFLSKEHHIRSLLPAAEGEGASPTGADVPPGADDKPASTTRRGGRGRRGGGRS